MAFKPKDHYFKKAKQENYLARSVYKLEEIDKKDKIFKKGNHVVDLGYHPGSWTQYASKAVGEGGLIVGIDIKPVNKKVLSSKNVRLFEKDVFDVSTIEDVGGEKMFDVLLSDMAPNTTGMKSVDQDRSLNLVEKIFAMLPTFLEPGGNMVIKVFDSNQAQEFLKAQKKRFQNIKYLKPKSTRSSSKEFFVIGKGFKA